MSRILYDYYRSSACYRVRIALNLKKLPYQREGVHLIAQGGEQHARSYQVINPEERVPTYIDQGIVLTQSLAIIEYLDARYSTPLLVPLDPIEAAFVRSIAQLIACDIHPLNNLGVLQYLTQEMQVSESMKQDWYHHWIQRGFFALETRLGDSPYYRGLYCCGNQVSMADICLIPQVYNACRFQVDMTAYPIINKINALCLSLEAFQKASPESIAMESV